MTKTTKTRHALQAELKALKVERVALALSQDSWINGTAERRALLDREMALCSELAARDSNIALSMEQASKFKRVEANNRAHLLQQIAAHERKGGGGHS